MRRVFTVRPLAAAFTTTALAVGFVMATMAPADADAAAPDPVSRVSIRGHTSSSTESALTVRWTNPDGGDLEGVLIERSARADGSDSTELAAAVTGTSFEDATVAPGDSYWYILTAHDAAGNDGATVTLPVFVNRGTDTATLSGRIVTTTGRPLYGA